MRRTPGGNTYVIRMERVVQNKQCRPWQHRLVTPGVPDSNRIWEDLLKFNKLKRILI